MNDFSLLQSFVRRPYQIILIIALVLIAFAPVTFGEFCSVDDAGMIASLAASEPTRMQDVFVPTAAEGVYYRPMLFLSFLADKYVFDLDAGIMHIENILLHALSSLLIFWLVYQLLPDERRRTSYLPLVAALFFGIHPITTESVSWVSGRTDVLACVFILGSVNFLLLFKQRHLYPYLVFSVIFMFLGFVAKETALLFLPGFFLLVSAKDSGTEEKPVQGGDDSSRTISGRAMIVLSGLGALFLFYSPRSAAFLQHGGKLRYTIQAILLDPFYSAMVVLEAFAFYMKKIFLPLPLNFAIIEIDPLYEFIALPLVIACIMILLKRTVRSALFMAGVFLITPAFFPAFGQLAWTSYAERYVYIPTAFIMTATVLYAGEFFQGKYSVLRRRMLGVVTVILIVLAAVMSFQRSMIWSSNLSLFQDTITKSPTFYLARAEYARALALSGDYQNALSQFRQAKKEDQKKVGGGAYVKSPFYSGRFGYWPNPDLGVAYILVQLGRTEDAVDTYERIYTNLPACGEQKDRVVDSLVSLYGDLLGKARTIGEKREYEKKLSFYAGMLYDIKRNPELLFHVGKLFLGRGEKEEALDYFRKSYELFHGAHPYKAIAQTYVKRLTI